MVSLPWQLLDCGTVFVECGRKLLTLEAPYLSGHSNQKNLLSLFKMLYLLIFFTVLLSFHNFTFFFSYCPIHLVPITTKIFKTTPNFSLLTQLSYAFVNSFYFAFYSDHSTKFIFLKSSMIFVLQNLKDIF